MLATLPAAVKLPLTTNRLSEEPGTPVPGVTLMSIDPIRTELVEAASFSTSTKLTEAADTVRPDKSRLSMCAVKRSLEPDRRYSKADLIEAPARVSLSLR